MKENFKSGFVTLIGRPNVGKSTLMNQLIGQKIAITSNKPQTTRNRIQTVLTTEEGQIVFVDTPGIHKAKNKLGEYMVNIAERSLNEVDVVLWLVEPTNFIGAGERHIIEQLKKVKTPVILVINKIDMVKREEILTFIDTYRTEYDFAEIVPVSARSGENSDELVRVIMQYLPYGPQFYDEDTITDQPERQIVAELIREKALRSLDEEIPHGIAVAIESMKYRKNIADIEATIICEKDSHKGIIIGKGGQMVRSAGNSAQLMAKEGKYATLRLPSGEMRMVPIVCRATVGVVGNGDHNLINIGKAGRKRHMGIRPTVRGSVMNPNDHPHGGGEGKTGIGRPGPSTPWGKPALGLKTRKAKKASNKLIVRRRDGKAIK